MQSDQLRGPKLCHILYFEYQSNEMYDAVGETLTTKTRTNWDHCDPWLSDEQ